MKTYVNQITDRTPKNTPKPLLILRGKTGKTIDFPQKSLFKTMWEMFITLCKLCYKLSLCQAVFSEIAELCKK